LEIGGLCRTFIAKDCFDVGTAVIAYAYDAANRLLESREVGGDVTVYEWDDAGRLLGTAVDSTHGRTYTYDQRGNLTSFVGK
jgi:YD repeat-containing protein